jgi:hypothetical protein
MADKPPGFFVLVGRLLSALGRLGKAVQEQEEGIAIAVTETAKAANEKKSVPEFVRAEVSVPKGVEIHKSTADATDDKDYQCRTLLVSWLSFIVAVATLVSLIIYACISSGQLREMRRQVAVSSDTEQRQLRAYLLPDGARVEFSKDGSYIVYIQFKNSGQTPAYTVVHWLTADIQDDIADPFHELFESHKIKWRKTGPKNVDLGSGQSMCLMLKGTSVTPSLPLGKAIYVWGDVKYKDAFQRECQFDAFLLKSTERLDTGRVLSSFMNWASDKNPDYKYKCDTSGKVILPPEKFDELPALPPEEVKSMVYVGECPKPESKPK